MIVSRIGPARDAFPLGNSAATPRVNRNNSMPRTTKFAIWIQPREPSDSALIYVLSGS